MFKPYQNGLAQFIVGQPVSKPDMLTLHAVTVSMDGLSKEFDTFFRSGFLQTSREEQSSLVEWFAMTVIVLQFSII